MMNQQIFFFMHNMCLGLNCMEIKDKMNVAQQQNKQLHQYKYIYYLLLSSVYLVYSVYSVYSHDIISN